MCEIERESDHCRSRTRVRHAFRSACRRRSWDSGDAHRPPVSRGDARDGWKRQPRTRRPVAKGPLRSGVRGHNGAGTASRVVEPLRGEANARLAGGTTGGRPLTAADAWRAVVKGVQRRAMAATVADRLVRDVEGRPMAPDLVGQAHALWHCTRRTVDVVRPSTFVMGRSVDPRPAGGQPPAASLSPAMSVPHRTTDPATVR